MKEMKRKEGRKEGRLARRKKEKKEGCDVIEGENSAGRQNNIGKNPRKDTIMKQKMEKKSLNIRTFQSISKHLNIL